jgi:hypothetical protein
MDVQPTHPLKDALKSMSCGDSSASSRANVNMSQERERCRRVSCRPLGDNPNLACYMDGLYAYLRARANETWTRPPCQA